MPSRPPRSRINLYGLGRPGLRRLLEEAGAAPYHADQAFRWLYRLDRLDPSAWTDLPLALRSRILDGARVEEGSIDDRAEAADGTVKCRIALAEGDAVETVLLVQSGRATLCLSTQVGCALGCRFCLTGRMGFLRNLGPGEIVGQVALAKRERALGDGPFNVVLMGMGEPLRNYDAVIEAFRLLTDPEGFGLSHRRITLSTAGLAPEIERLAREPRRPRLAVSLNATTDEIRDRLMPINRRFPIARLREACRVFARETGDGFTFEYVLLAGVNDSDADVARLARIARAHPAKLNLIPFNPVPGQLDFRPTARERTIEIRDRLAAMDVRVAIRWSRGAEARAACGQLAVERGPSSPRAGRGSAPAHGRRP